MKLDTGIRKIMCPPKTHFSIHFCFDIVHTINPGKPGSTLSSQCI